MADMASTLLMKQALQLVSTLNLTAWQFPADCKPANGSFFDFIIVGGGTAGSVLANRLSTNESFTVLLLEAGGYPPMESELPGLFIMLKDSVYDYKYRSVNDNYTMQNLKNKTCFLTNGKMLGGTSSLYPMMYTRPDPRDYDVWVQKTNDSAWNVTNTLPYYLKQERLTDKELLQSKYARLHGTEGMIKLKRELNPKVNNILSAFQEAGHPIVMDITSLNSALGYTELLYAIDDGERQSSALCYLGPAKTRPNLCVALFSTATKILMKNKVAVGVQVLTSDNETLVFYAKKEVIVSAGTFNSPKLLMLSGIGPKAHLESFGIDVIADLPVGKSYTDQPALPILILMENSSEVAGASNPHIFPLPTFFGNAALNSTSGYPYYYQTINFLCPPDSTDLLNMCSLFLGYSDEICDNMYKSSKNRVSLLSMVGLTFPESRGEVLLASKDPIAAPIVNPGIYRDSADLNFMARATLDHIRVMNTTYFKNVNATILDLGFCLDKTSDEEFWECYALAMTTTIWHVGGTCAMGLVLDSSMKVKGVDSLRVVDSSSMPAPVTGKPYSVIGMLAERAADLIRTDYNII